MAFIANGTSISIGGTLVDATDISISASSAVVDATALNSVLSTAIQGRPTVTGSATIHTDNATGLSLAQKFCGATPSTGAVSVAISASGAGSGGVDFTGTAIITGYSPTYTNDTVHSATVTWQYVGEITAARA
jgi:hypothetical protein